MSQPFPAYPNTPMPAPTPERKRFGAMSITALVLGTIAICGSPIPILNNATIVAGFVGVVFAVIGLFGWRKAMAAIGGALAVAGIFIGIALQIKWSDDISKIGSPAASETAAHCKVSSQAPPCWGSDGQWINASGVPATSGPTYQYNAPSPTSSTPPPIGAGDFAITLKTVSKQCFGSYGCNMVVEPGINYKGSADQLTSYGRCSITYTITGNKDGDVTETAYGAGGTEFTVSRSVLTTASSKVEPKATVTSVSCN